MRTYEGNLDPQIRILDLLCQANIPRKARCAGKQNEELVILRNLDGFVGGNVVRGSIEQPRTLQHPRRVSKPDRVPI